MSEERQQPDGADEERQRWPGWEERDPDAGGPRKHGIRRFLPGWRLVLGSFLALVVLVCGGFLVGYLLVDIPAANAAATQQSNVYLYADGTQLASDGDVNRENISLSDLPKPVRHAVLAAEDRDFYTGSAVDPQAMIRGAWKTVTGKGKQSGSTITQQYVKNYYLDQDQTVTRKAKEFFIAIKLDRETSKDEILEGYLNTSYFGRNAYGIQAAAQAYYGIDARDLNTAQGAYLASLLNAPSAYDVIAQPANRSRAEARWNYVLDGMVKENWLTESGRARLSFPTPDEQHLPRGLSGQRGYLVQAVDAYLVSHGVVSEAQLAKGGHRITTTLVKGHQDALVKAVDDKLISKLDKKERKADRNVRAGGVAIDPDTGKVLAMYGGIDYTEQYVNNATRRDYQVGSTFKPFVLSAAMEYGIRNPDLPPEQTEQQRTIVSPKSIYDGDNKLKVKNYDGTIWHNEKGEEWHQRNDGDRSEGDVDLRTAMQFSTNTPYIQLAMDVGLDKVRQTAEAAGIKKDNLPGWRSPSFALGTSAPSAIRLAGAYATFAASGKQVDPYSVESIEGKDGEVWNHDSVAKVKQGIPADVADNVTDVLRTVVQEGTGTAAKPVDAQWPTAGKTGTTDGNKSAWFAGYTRQLSTAIGMFRVNDQAKNQKFLEMYGTGDQESIHGASFPAEIWTEYMLSAMKGKSPQQFPEPSELGTIVGEPTPTPTPTPTETEQEESPDPTPTTEAPPETPDPDPTTTCRPLDWECRQNENGGNENGGNENGGPGDPGGGQPTTEPPPEEGETEGNDNGGSWFGNN